MERAIRLWNYVSQYSGLLFLGAGLALLWANLNLESYRELVNFVIIDHFWIGHAHADESGAIHRTLTLHYLINDVLMAMFFFIAGKEVWEGAALKNGALRGKKALTPLIATMGGMLGPIAVFFGLATFMGGDVLENNIRGWAIPTATDIAFCLIVARIVFGAAHPAVGFLLLLAIADDACGIIILAIFYPTGEKDLVWLLYALGIIIWAGLAFNFVPRYIDRKNGGKSEFYLAVRKLGSLPYILVGWFSWYCFQESGVHPALGLLPILPIIPHAENDLGIFAKEETKRRDLLNLMEHRLKFPVEIVVFFFGLLNAGVVFSAVGDATWLVFGGLVIGKPVGILLFGWTAAVILGLGLPHGMKMRDVFVLGCVAAIGFTVALFVASVAYPAGGTQDQAKMGALFSFFASFIAIIAGRMLKVERMTGKVATSH